ncbi:hypothetical protein G6F65_018003 [Rhizopus arrhizus]|nr:hypothetical protein G6F65_018003 [Rhizopus arrhizus]
MTRLLSADPNAPGRSRRNRTSTHPIANVAKPVPSMRSVLLRRGWARSSQKIIPALASSVPMIRRYRVWRSTISAVRNILTGSPDVTALFRGPPCPNPAPDPDRRHSIAGRADRGCVRVDGESRPRPRPPARIRADSRGWQRSRRPHGPAATRSARAGHHYAAGAGDFAQPGRRRTGPPALHRRPGRHAGPIAGRDRRPALPGRAGQAEPGRRAGHPAGRRRAGPGRGRPPRDAARRDRRGRRAHSPGQGKCAP